MIVDALIVAAGVGGRFGGALPKQYAELAGQAVLAHAAQAFIAHPAIRRTRAVIHNDHRKLFQSACGHLELGTPVFGGPSRQASVLAGLESLMQEGAPEKVLIHDGARPCLSEFLLDRIIEALSNAHAVLPAIAVVDSLKRVADDHIAGEVDRSDLIRAQTPQAFTYDVILKAHRKFANEDFTDDTGIVRRAGHRVRIVEGDPANIKITQADDLIAMQARYTHLSSPRRTFRSGVGYDVHRLVEGRPLILGGITIPFSRGLGGHSDADVALHAITDAILGAISDGDIGHHFPPSDLKWKNADSAQFLMYTAERVAARGGKIENIDLTIICEMPKIGPYRELMISRIAEILMIESSLVGVKATTTEGLGFTGRGEGIAAQAIAMVSMPT